jgi:RNA polymerase sigma factor (sigma-70 family)
MKGRQRFSRNPSGSDLPYTRVWGPSDESLLAGLAAGDVDAAVAFVRRFQRRVHGLALTIVGDPDAAEDVAQETFLRAWRHAAAYDARRGRVSTWLLAIARNLAIDAVRLKGGDRADRELLASHLLVSGGRDEPGDRAGQLDDSERVRAALAGLPEEQRQAVVLAGCFGRTANEISELEGVPLGTVKTRIRTAMIKLREELEVRD